MARSWRAMPTCMAFTRASPHQPSSFGSFRAKLISFALRRTLQAGGTKDQFVALALRHFTEAGIDPRQPHMHGSTPQTRRRVRQVLARLQAGNGVAPN
jgi:hypothetical protein